MRYRLSVLAALTAAIAFGQASSVTVMGVYLSSPPTLSNGNTARLLLDSAGNLKVNVAAGATSNACASATGAAVPASGCYAAVNIGGNLVGQTGVTVSAINAADVNLNVLNGVAIATGNGVVGTGVQRVAIASDNSAFSVNVANTPAVTQSGTWNVGLSAGTNVVGYTWKKNACGTTAYEAGFQYLTGTSAQVTATKTCIDRLYFNNTDTVNHTVDVVDQSTGCNSGACALLTAFTLPASGFVTLELQGMAVTGGFKWNSDTTNKVVGNVVGNQ